MKRILFLWLLLSFLCPSVVRAETPSAFGTFWKNFQDAVAKDDKEAVSAMTSFPFLYQNSLDKAGFLKVYPKIFDAHAKSCIRRLKPESDQAGAYDLFCGYDIFHFSKVGGEFRFSDLGAND